MLFVLIATICSFKMSKTAEGNNNNDSKSVIIENSHFQAKGIPNQNKNKIKNGKITNSEFKLENAGLMETTNTDYSNTHLIFSSDPSKFPLIYTEDVTITSLTIEGPEFTDANQGIFSFTNSINVNIDKLTLTGVNKATLFSGSVSSLTLTNSDISGFQKDDTHEIKSVINLDLLTGNTLTFKDSTFHGNQVSVLSNTGDKSTTGTVTLENCKFEQNNEQCIYLENENIYNTRITNCKFNENEGMEGCAIFCLTYIESPQPLVTIDNCVFSNNKCLSFSDAKGCVCIDTVVQFTGVNHFINNEARMKLEEGMEEGDSPDTSIGGSLVVNQYIPSLYTLSNLVFENSYAGGYGGALVIYCGDFEEGDPDTSKHLFITVDNCTFTNCSSGRQGGAMKCGFSISDNRPGDMDNDVNITNCLFKQCKSPEGGALYFMDGTEEGDEETVIQYCTFDGCIGSTGSAIFCRSYKFELSHSIFCNSEKVGQTTERSEIESFLFAYLDEEGIAPVINNCTFNNNEQNIEFKVHTVSIEGTEPNSITFTQCHFHDNNQQSNGDDSIIDLQYIQSGTVTFEKCLFEHNKGQCIKQESELISYTYVSNCVFNGNEGGQGCAIYFSTLLGLNEIRFTIENCKFENNKCHSTSDAQGCVIIETELCQFVGVNEFINNEASNKAEVEEGSEENVDNSFGGSLVVVQINPAQYTLSNLVFENSYAGGYGGAIVIYCGDFEEGDPETKKHLFITVENCTFTNCSSGSQGGAMKCGTSSGWNPRPQFDNDVNISNCIFKQCQSPEGGALYFMDGTEEGDEETVIQYCTFDGCSSSKSGSSIYCRSYKFELSHSTFENMKGKGTLLYANLDEKGIEPKIIECTFTNNEQRIEFHSGIAGTPSNNSITFYKCTFTHNCESTTLTTISILQLEFIQSERVTFENCLFKQNGGQCINQDSETICNTHIYKCEFSNNEGHDGCAISTTTSSNQYKMTVEDCIFKNNKLVEATAGNYGTVVAYSKSIEFAGTNQFIDNEVCISSEQEGGTDMDLAHGGSLFIMQEEPTEYTISNLIITNSYSQHYGGGISIYSGDYQEETSNPNNKHLFVSIENCVFTNCSSGKQGGALKCGVVTPWEGIQFDNDVRIRNCQFIRCKSPEGGALYFMDGTKEGDEETVIEYCTFDGCIGSTGSAILCQSYSFNMSHSIICNSEQVGETTDMSETESFLYLLLNEDGITPVINNCTFNNNEQNFEIQVHGTSIEEGTKPNSVTFLQCNFHHNNQKSNGADTIVNLEYIMSTLITFDECLFEHNKGQCIKQESLFLCQTVITKCTFSENEGGQGCAVYCTSELTNPQQLITIDNCIFKKNLCKSNYQAQGCVCVDTSLVKFTGVNHFINNEVRYQLEEGMEGEEYVDDSFGGSLVIKQSKPDVYSISNLVIENSYAGGFGGALVIYCGDFEEGDPETSKHLFITVENCTFTNCSSGRQGGAMKCGTSGGWNPRPQFDNDVNISNCIFKQCRSPEGGALYFMDGTEEGDEETVIQYCTFEKCDGPLGSAIYCRSYKFELSHSIFKDSAQSEIELEEMPDVQSFLYANLDEKGIKPVITNCTFENNEQNIEFHSLDSSSTTNSITFIKCTFVRNNQESNGHDTVFDLQYIQSGTVTFEDCLFEQNAGYCIKQDSDTLICNTHIYKCVFNNNNGGSGCAIFSLTTKSDNKPMMTVEDCVFSNNQVTSTYAPRGGAVFATTVSINFVGNNQFINNRAVYEGYDGKLLSKRKSKVDPGFNQRANGGSLYIIQETENKYVLSNVSFTKSSSTEYGGAFSIAGLDDEELFSKLSIDINNCTFENCSAINGGSICTTIEGTLSIQNCNFTGGKAENGGEIYCTDDTVDTPSVLNISNCAFTNSQASTSGGAVYSRTGSISLTSNNFTNCLSSDKGSAVFLSTEANATIENNIIQSEKKTESSPIYYTANNTNATLYLAGGCYSINSENVLIFDSNAKIEFLERPCFQGSKEESIKFLGNHAVDLPDDYFNCHECDDVLIFPPDTEDKNNNGGTPKPSKLSVGAIAGIVVGCVAFVAIVVVAVIFFIRKRKNYNDIKSESVANDNDGSSAYALDSRTDNNIGDTFGNDV